MKTKRAGQVKQEFPLPGSFREVTSQPVLFMRFYAERVKPAIPLRSKVGSVHAPSVRPCLSTPLHSLSLLSNIGPCLPVLASPKPRLCPPSPFPGPLLSTSVHACHSHPLPSATVPTCTILSLPANPAPLLSPAFPLHSSPRLPFHSVQRCTPVHAGSVHACRSRPILPRPILGAPFTHPALSLRSMPAVSFHSQPHRMEPMPSMATRAVPAAPIRADPCRSRCFPSCSAPLLSDAAVPCHSQPLLVPPRLPVPAGPYPIPPIRPYPGRPGRFQVLSKSLPRPIRAFLPIPCRLSETLCSDPFRYASGPYRSCQSSPVPSSTIPALSHPLHAPPCPACQSVPFRRPFSPIPCRACRAASGQTTSVQYAPAPVRCPPCLPAKPRRASSRPVPTVPTPCPIPPIAAASQAVPYEPHLCRPAFPLPRQSKSTPIHFVPAVLCH
jgi:hypothetical protein